MDATIDSDIADAELLAQFVKYKDDLQKTAQFILDSSGKDANFEGAISYNFLMQMGYVCGAWYHLRSFILAQAKINDGDGDALFYENKQLAAKFFMNQLLPRAAAFGDAVVAGADVGCALSPAAFS